MERRRGAQVDEERVAKFRVLARLDDGDGESSELLAVPAELEVDVEAPGFIHAGGGLRPVHPGMVLVHSPSWEAVYDDEDDSPSLEALEALRALAD